MEIYDLLVASGLLGILISTTANLIVSIKSLQHQRSIEGYKVSLSFLKEKFDILKDSREIFSETISLDSAWQAIKNDDNKAAIEHFKNNKNRYFRIKAKYDEIKIFFDEKTRQSLENLNKDIDLIDTEGAKILINHLDKKIQKVTPDFINKITRYNEMIIDFEREFKHCIEKELITMSEKLSTIDK